MRPVRNVLTALAVTGLAACSADFDNPVGDASYDAGQADLSTYVAVGDSLTAGYADGAVYISGQEASFANIMAQQFAKVGGGAFRQPLMDDEIGGLLLSGTAIADPRLVFDLATETPVAIDGTPTTEIHPALNQNPLSGAYNNTGIPGAKSFHLVAADYGNVANVAAGTANPYFVRFASTASATAIADAAAQQPSFFTLWIGNNDVLAYATSGGTGTDQTGNTDVSTYGGNDITDPTAFAGVYSSLVTTLQASNSNNKGVLITLPDVNALPYFTTVTYNAIPLDEATVTALNTGFAAYNQGLATAVANNLIDADEQAQRTISFAAGNNAFTIEDETLTDLSGLGLPSIRQSTADDLTVITASSLLGTDNTGPQDVWGLSATSALGDEYLLLPSEQQAITTARNAMNATIKSIVDGDANLALFDAAAFMDDLAANGYDYGSGKLTTSFVTGGAFSLDGIHLTPRGNAVAANQIIGVINQAFGANIPVVDPVTYSTVTIK